MATISSDLQSDDFSPRSSRVLQRKHLSSKRKDSKYDYFWRKVRIKLRSKYYVTNPRYEIDAPVPDRVLSECETSSFLPQLIIHPDSKPRFLWNTLIFITLIYTAFVTSFTIAFMDSSYIDAWESIDLAIDFIYFLDFVLNCNSAFFDSDGNLIISRKAILAKYVKGWMAVDILSFIPFSLIEFATNSQTSKTNKFARFIKLPRLYKLFKLSRLLKLLNGQKTQELVSKIQDYFSIKHSATRFFISITSIVISVHVTSCMWYYTAVVDEFSPDTWVVRYDLQDSDTVSIYITCLYWSFTTLTTVGYGDIAAVTIGEKILSILWMLLSLYFIGFTIGSLSSFMANNHTKEKNLTQKLAAIDEFVADSKLNKSMARKLRHALKYSTAVSGFPWADKLSIFNELPKGLRYEVARCMHHGAARQISFFVDKDPVIVSTIIPFLSPLCVGYKETVYRQEDYADEIYFIVKGWVNYVFNDTCVISSIYKSDYFGDIEVIFQVGRKYDAVANRNLELLSMNRKLLNKVKIEYLRVWEEMKKTAIERDRKNKIVHAKLCRRTGKFIKKTLIQQDSKPIHVKMDDISDQIAFLFEFATTLSNKFNSIKNSVMKLEEQTLSNSENEQT